MPLSREQFQALRDKGLSVEQIVRFESGERGQTLAPTGQPPAPALPRKSNLGAMPIAGHPLLAMAQDGGDVSSMLGMPGGLLPGPMGRAASFAGGGLGELIDQIARGQQINPRGIVREAGSQMLQTVGGQVLGGASRLAGRGAMSLALRPNVAMVRRSPGVVVDALEQGATVRGGGERAAGKVLGERSAVTNAGVAKVDREGVVMPGGARAKVNVRMSSMIPRVDDVIAAKSSKSSAQREEAHKVIQEMLDSYKTPENMAGVKAIKQQLQDEAQAIWEALPNPNKPNLRFNDKGVPIGEAVPIEARIKFATAQRLQKFMEGIPEGSTGIKGGFKASEKATQKAINVRRAVADATQRADAGLPSWVPQGFGRGSLVLGGGAVGQSYGDDPMERLKYGLMGAAGGGMVGDPAVTSRLAHLLYQQYALPALMRQAPRGIGSLFTSGEMPADTLDNRRYRGTEDK